MSLSISKYFQVKTVKLSDSYVVLLRFPDEDEPLVLFNCTGFTVPKIEYNEEIMYYGNVSQSFLIPKYDAIKEMSIKFLESQNDSILQKFIKNGNSEKSNSYFLNIGKGYVLEQTRGKVSYSKNFGTYNINSFDLDELRIDIYDNNFNTVVYSYIFNNLKIIKYEMYELDYTNESPCEISITFMFEGYARGADLNENENLKNNKKLGNFGLEDLFKTDQEPIKRNEERKKQNESNQTEKQKAFKNILTDNSKKNKANMATAGNFLSTGGAGAGVYDKDHYSKKIAEAIKNDESLASGGNIVIKPKKGESFIPVIGSHSVEFSQEETVMYNFLIEHFNKEYVEEKILGLSDFSGGILDRTTNNPENKIKQAFALVIQNKDDLFTTEEDKQKLEEFLTKYNLQ